MPVDRHLFTSPINGATAPHWRCPTCAAGFLRLDKKSVITSWDSATEQTKNEDWFDHDHVSQRFAAILKCDNQQCLESVVASGTGYVDAQPDERMEHLEYVDVLRPENLNPSPTLIDIPKRCPVKVTKELRAAFVVSWGDFPAAGNHIRTAVEHLLDALGVNKTNGKKGAARRFLTLHDRIGNLKANHHKVRDELMAIKWLGNAGSHIGELDRASVFDALDIFEAVLHGLYLDHPKAIKRLVKKVNKQKGPVRKRQIKPVAF